MSVIRNSIIMCYLPKRRLKIFEAASLKPACRLGFGISRYCSYAALISSGAIGLYLRLNWEKLPDNLREASGSAEFLVNKTFNGIPPSSAGSEIGCLPWYVSVNGA